MFSGGALAANLLRGAGGGGDDPDFANVVLLSGFEGSDGSSSFTDESSFARTMTAAGNAQIDTAWSQFGSSSALFDGTGDWITMADSDDFHFGYGAFTIDAFIRPTSVGTNRAIFSQFRGLGSQRSFVFGLYSGGLRFLMSTGANVGVNADTSAGVDFQAAYSFSNSTTYHVRVDRTAADPSTGGSVARLYVDGTMIGSRATALANQGTNISLLNSTAGVWIGGINNNSGEWPWQGWIDELRVVKGEALCASDGGFTVPTSAYPRS